MGTIFHHVGSIYEKVEEKKKKNNKIFLLSEVYCNLNWLGCGAFGSVTKTFIFTIHKLEYNAAAATSYPGPYSGYMYIRRERERTPTVIFIEIRSLQSWQQQQLRSGSVHAN